MATGFVRCISIDHQPSHQEELVAFFFSLSGQRGTGRTKVYQLLEDHLPERFPDVSIAFLGNPLPNLQLPLSWQLTEQELHATTRLMSCWTVLNEFCVKKLRPALAEYDVIITDGFGLDALLYATALCDHVAENDEAFRLHDGLVSARIRAQGLEAPEYIITQADAGVVDRYMCDFKHGAFSVDPKKRWAFIQYEERTISQYFERIAHQKNPYFVDASLSIEDMGHTIIDFIARRIKASSMDREVA